MVIQFNKAIGHLYTKGPADGLAKSFLDYMLSPAVQNGLVPAMFYAPIGRGPAATPPVVVGPTSPSPAASPSQ